MLARHTFASICVVMECLNKNMTVLSVDLFSKTHSSYAMKHDSYIFELFQYT